MHLVWLFAAYSVQCTHGPARSAGYVTYVLVGRAGLLMTPA